MSHVTVVEVDESLIKNFVEEAALRRGVEALRKATEHKQECRIFQRKNLHGIDTQNGLCKCTVSKMIPMPEDLYVNFNDIQKRVYGMTPDTPSTLLGDKRDLPKIHTSRGLVRKCSIIDQNVGVTGTVFMLSDPSCQQPLDTSDDESDSSLTSSVSSLSESDSGLSNTIEVDGSPAPHHATTITIGEEHKLHNNQVLLHIPGATEGDNIAETREHATEEDLEEAFSIQTNEPKIADSTDTTMTLEWRVIPPSSPILQQPVPLELEGDRGSTPTSFSSAYTVTELESESTSEDSEASRHNWLGQESDEELHGIPRIANCHSPEGTLLCISEDNSLPWRGENQHLPGTNNSDSVGSITSGHHIVLDITGNTIKSVSRAEGAPLGCELREELYRLRHSSDSSSCGGDSIVYSYIPCRDQREKEDEELWVANEAADPEGSQSFQGVAPPLLLPPWGWGGSLGRGSGKPEPTKRGPVWAEQLRASHGCVTAPSCVSSLMCTLAPSLGAPVPVGTNTTQRKHYSTRQRVVESQIITVVDEEPKYQQNWNKLNNGDTETQSENLQTATTTNIPTKKFSFLIRSNSVKQESVTDTNSVPAARQPVTPSDQAILDKLATLNIEAPGVVFKPRTRCSLFEPPCVRCGEPVYLQERTEPTLRLVYHSSCFKCHKCGVRLTLKTFFRSPLDSKDSRVFCKSHVPSLDPGRLDPGRPDTSSGKSAPNGTRPDSHSDTCRISSNSRHVSKMSLQDELDIVKCDTIGLRYF